MKASQNNRNCRRWVLLWALVVAVGLLPNQAQAATKNWVGKSGWWDVGANWAPVGQPADGDSVRLMQDDKFNRKVRYRDRVGTVLDSLYINASGTGTMTLYLNRDLLTAEREYIGIGLGDELVHHDTGNVFQKGGNNKVGSLYLGFNRGASGIYELRKGELESNLEEYLGYFGNATFNQSGGTHVAYGDLYLAYGAHSSSTYNLGRGKLDANYETIGFNGTGVFNQTGGTHTATHLFLGYETGSSGTYNLSHGRLGPEVPSWPYWNEERIGYYGTGVFNQTGGTHNAIGVRLGCENGSIGTYNQSGGTHTTNMLWLAEELGSTGTYMLSGGSLEVIYANPFDTVMWSSEKIGINSTGGTFIQTGGTHFINGYLVLGDFSGGKGTYLLSGGSLDEILGPIIGYEGRGYFIQTGGEHNIRDDLSVAMWSGSEGTYELHGGSLSAARESIGGEGEGVFTQTGGTHTVIYSDYLSSGKLTIGTRSTGHGTYHLAGGSLSTYHTTVGAAGTGTFTQTAGTHTIAHQLMLGSDAGSTGSYELSGGSLSSDMTTVGAAGTGTFIQTAGTHTIDHDLILANDAGSTGTYELRGGSLSSDMTTVGAAGTGTFIQTAGTHTIGRELILACDAGSTGTYELRGGSLSSDMTTVGSAGRGTFTQTWGTNEVATQLTLGASHVIPFNQGTYNLLGGELIAGGMQVNLRGTFNQEGGTLNCGDLENLGSITLRGGITEVHGTFLNHAPGMVEIANSATFYGDAANMGTIKVTGTTVTWAGTFIDSGTYISDPATQTFNNLFVLPGGVMVADQGDYFLIKNNFINLSEANQAWNTQAACLRFIQGNDNRHALFLPGLDLGPTLDGYLNNFAWGCLDLMDQRLVLWDGNQTPGGALYVKEILGIRWDEDLVTNIFGHGLNIYYDPLLLGNEYLEGMTFDLKGGGYLMPMGFNIDGGGYPMQTPLPPSAWLFLSGLAGLGLLRRGKKLWKS